MKNKIYIVIEEIFKVGFATYVVYLGLELWLEGLVSNYFDLNILLLVVIFSGLVTLFHRKSQSVV